ncbi:MAG: BlaI/MecI/CopY family transcriptional regulator [Planctomycetales bacterium]|nr:BlaI/MecI/CopY family transcriptional regulator [Planctomycetales bacterium]MCA9169202.1 BlaI/MecI/CopY family transcriptional regulator [Planctomycetales bacterium]
MPNESIDDLSPLQQKVMDIIWGLKEASVHDVRRALSSRRKQPAYTTVLSVMQKLETAGWLDHRANGKAYTYFPTRSQQRAQKNSLQQFVSRVFGGDMHTFFQHLLDDEQLTIDDLVEFRKRIDKRKKELGNDQ